MTERLNETLPCIPFDRPEYIERQISRLAFMHELLQPDGTGEVGAVLLPTDHDGDEIPESLELVLTEREMWRLYSDGALLPNREAFLTDTPTGRTISGHLAMVNHLSKWSNFARQREHLISLETQPGPDKYAVATWTMENLGIDIENTYRASQFSDVDPNAYDAVALASIQIEGAYKELQAATLLLMAVPELQIGHEGQALHLRDKREGTWLVRTIMGNGLLVLMQDSGTSPIKYRRVATIEEMLAWNDLNFVPNQASGVHDIP